MTQAARGIAVFAPDFDHLIDLPGAGPCPRPVDLDRARTGFSDLVSLRVYRFPAGVTIDGEAEGDEVFMVLMRGEADVAALQDCAQVGDHSLRVDGGERALYLPPGSAYRLTARTRCDVAYARARPEAERFPPPQGFGGTGAGVAVADHALGMTLHLVRAAPGGERAAMDGGKGERFLHVRAEAGGEALVNDVRLGDWDAAATTGPLTLRAQGGVVDVLGIAAR